MTPLTTLWLPILVSAVIVFIASSALHMLPLWHKSDFPAVPDQDRAADAIRPLGIPPGEYMMPRAANMAEMKTPAFEERMNKGPIMMMTVLPNRKPGMGKPMALWFIYCVIVSFFAASVAGAALPPGAPHGTIWHFAAAIAFIAYAVGLWQDSIWYWRSWTLTLKSTVDGLIYAVITGAEFVWLWPH